MTPKLMIAAAFAAMAVAQPALADSITVNVGDLDLATPQGRMKLERRIHSAAKEICSVNGERDLASLSASRRCYSAARASVEQQVAALIARKTRRV